MNNAAALVNGEYFAIVSNRGDRADGHLSGISAVSTQLISRDARLGRAAGIGVALARSLAGIEQCTLHVTLDDGRAFTLIARDNDALISSFIAFEDAVAAYRTKHAARRLHDGETLSFGPELSLSRDAIVYRGKTLRLAEITGYALNAYNVAIDRRYRLAMQVDAGAPNFSSFSKVLDGLLPGKNLGAAAHDPQPETPWYAVSANTYRPGQASLRSRVAMFALIPSIAILYCAVMLIPAWRGFSRADESFKTFETRQLYMRTLEAQLDARAMDLPRTCPALTSMPGDDAWLTILRSGDRSSVHGVYGAPGNASEHVIPSAQPTFGDAWSQAIMSGGHVYFQIPITSRWVIWKEGTEDQTLQATAKKNKKVNYVVADAENKKLLCGGTVLTDSIDSSDVGAAFVEASRGRR